MSLTTVVLSFLLAGLLTGAGLPGQSIPSASSECSQPTRERNAIIREAERDRYTTRRIEFIGNQYTSDMVLRRRINTRLNEGDLFTRRNLIRSLRNVSKLKVIYPVNITNVTLQLNRSEKTIDMMICFKEREGSNPKHAN